MKLPSRFRSKHRTSQTNTVAIGLLALFFLACPPRPEDSSVLSIPVAEAKSNNGSLWDDARLDLQAAIEEASDWAKKGVRAQVLIKKGTYYPSSCPNLTERTCTEERDHHFSLRNGVEVIGGFAGIETDGVPTLGRDKTVLSGDLGDKGVYKRADNVFHVFYHPRIARLDSTAVLRNVEISSGDSSDTYLSGAGMLNEESSPRIVDCIFRDNTAGGDGGGMYSVNSSPKIERTYFERNIASMGAGMYSFSGAIEIVDSYFVYNKAIIKGTTFLNGFAGGYYSNETDARISGTAFINNSSERSGGGFLCKKGKVTVTNTTFAFNKAGGSGGGISTDCNLTIISSTLSGNSAAFVGGIQALSAQPVVYCSIIVGNASGSGTNHECSGSCSNSAYGKGNLIGDGNEITVSSVFLNKEADKAILTECRGEGVARVFRIERGATLANNKIDRTVDPWDKLVPAKDQCGKDRGIMADIGAVESD